MKPDMFTDMTQTSGRTLEEIDALFADKAYYNSRHGEEKLDQVDGDHKQTVVEIESTLTRTRSNLQPATEA